MKKLFLVPFLSLFLFSCSSDDDATVSVNPLVGTWRMTAYEVESSYDFNQDGTSNTNLLAEVDCLQNETIQINNNGTAIAISNSFLTVVAELVIGTPDQFLYTANCDNETDSFQLTWTETGSTISFVDEDGFPTNATVDSSTQLSFTVPGGFEIISNDGSTVVVEEDLRVVYTRQ